MPIGAETVESKSQKKKREQAEQKAALAALAVKEEKKKQQQQREQQSSGKAKGSKKQQQQRREVTPPPAATLSDEQQSSSIDSSSPPPLPSQQQPTPPPQKKQQQKSGGGIKKPAVQTDLPFPNFDDSFSRDGENDQFPQFNIARFFETRDARSFPARGVTNPANLCYAAAVMQALTHCPPIAHFCATAGSHKVPRETKVDLAPTAALLGSWMAQYYKGMRATTANSTRTVPLPAPKLSSLKGLKIEGGVVDGARQQDAHELVVALLDALVREAASLKWDGVDFNAASNEEAGITTTTAGGDGNDVDSDEDGGTGKKKGSKKGGKGGGGGWTVVGAGKRSKLDVRKHTDAEGNDLTGGEDSTPGGFFKQIVIGTTSQHFKGTKGTKKGHTSVVLQPFIGVLTVDIGLKPKQTIEEAISYLSVKEVIENTADDGNEIRKVSFLSSLPEVLVIMLQRYVWTREGERVKLDNTVEIGSTMMIPGDAVDATLGKANGLNKVSNRTYGLQSIICHRGQTPNSGHYVTYVPDQPITKLQPGKGASNNISSFTVLNDSRVSTASWKELKGETPYLLWYQKLH